MIGVETRMGYWKENTTWIKEFEDQLGYASLKILSLELALCWVFQTNLFTTAKFSIEI